MPTPPPGQARPPGTFYVSFYGSAPLPDLTATFDNETSPQVSGGIIDATLPYAGGPVVLPTEWGPNFNSQELIDGKTELFTGACICPVAGPPGTPPEIISLHAPYTTRVVQWTVERFGDKPKLPSPTPTSPYETLAYATITNCNPGIDPANGVRVWRISGLYVFLQQNAPTGVLPVPGIRSSFDPATAFLNAVNDVQFDQTIAPSP